jgi:hypothetical protein
MPQILTANRLVLGEVVYWSEAKGWVPRLVDASTLADEAAAKAAQERGAESVRQREVVNPYLLEIRMDGGDMVPVKEREKIRARGPSVRPDLGKQAS